MALEKKQPSKLESAISFGLIIILIIIVAGIIKMQFIYRVDSVADWAPESFMTLGPAQIFTEENLYNKINGKAPLYTESGFAKLTTQRYINTENEELLFEIYTYDMAQVKNAFAVYSQQRRPDAKSLSGLKFAYSTSNAAYLVHGKYYCEIVGASDTPKLIDAIIQTTENLPKTLNHPGQTEISELKLFPAENLIPGSEKLYLKSAFGCAGLNNVFTATYKIDNQTFTAFISQQNDKQSAKRMFELYKNFLVENGGEIVKTQSDNPNIVYIEIFGLHEMIVIKDNYVFGIHEFEPSPAASELFELIFRNLPVKGDIIK